MGVCVSEEERTCEGGLVLQIEKRERENKKSESEIIKILNAHTIVTVHICTVIVAIVHLCTILHPLMWVFFFVKMCKMKGFLHFARFCIH